MCRAENTEARLRAEELVREEVRGREEAEFASQEMERQMAGLQGRNQELVAEVERLTHLLLRKPTVKGGEAIHYRGKSLTHEVVVAHTASS